MNRSKLGQMPVSARAKAMVGRVMVYVNHGGRHAGKEVKATVEDVRLCGTIEMEDGRTVPGVQLLMAGVWRGPFPDVEP